ncbi:hypothetical protein RIF29_43368 [Crotalaria pallida]|uniref:Uncharacterized protein n=1 Tax=Crotalaria pallida TaxID=3830 RepID=A0AAN9HMN3_CROPI
MIDCSPYLINEMLLPRCFSPSLDGVLFLPVFLSAIQCYKKIVSKSSVPMALAHLLPSPIQESGIKSFFYV